MSYTPPAGNEVNFSLSPYTPPAGNEVNFSFGKKVEGKTILAFGMSGRVGRPEWPDPMGVYGIWQMRIVGKQKVPYRMKFYEPTNPRTPAQQANRQKFAAAMTAWKSLTSEQKTAYTKAARKINLFGRNLFIREYYQKNKE